MSNFRAPHDNQAAAPDDPAYEALERAYVGYRKSGATASRRGWLALGKKTVEPSKVLREAPRQRVGTRHRMSIWGMCPGRLTRMSD